MDDLPVFWIVFGFVVVVVVPIWISRSMVRVPQAHAMVVEGFGRKYVRTITSGLNFVPWPIRQPKRAIPKLYTYSPTGGARARSRADAQSGDMRPLPSARLELHHDGFISLAEHMMDPPEIWAIASDNTRLQPDVLVFFSIIDAARAVYGVENLGESMLQLIQSTLRQEIAVRDADSVIAARSEISAALASALETATSNWGVKILRVELQEILFAPEVQGLLTRAREDELAGRAAKVAALRAGEARIAEAEAARKAEVIAAEARKQTAVLDAEAQKQALLIAAEAERESAVIAAEGRKKELVLLAEGRLEEDLMRARGIEAVGQAYERHGAPVLQERAIDAQIEIAKGLGEKGTTLVVPESVAGLTGALAVIGKTWKAVAGQGHQ
ncbi:MAG: paraslipin [Planctomycetota bacterium]|nr:paraslipin [Planctomycetota bacterium]